MARLAALLLDIAGTPCALARSEIREILPLPRLHEPPATGGPLAGFMNLAGEPVPVIDLAVLFDRPSDRTGFDPYKHVVLARQGTVALLVDRALDLVQVDERDFRPVEASRSLNGCVAAEFPHKNNLFHLLSIDRILTREEQTRLADLTRQARMRLAGFAQDEASVG